MNLSSMDVVKSSISFHIIRKDNSIRLVLHILNFQPVKGSRNKSHNTVAAETINIYSAGRHLSFAAMYLSPNAVMVYEATVRNDHIILMPPFFCKWAGNSKVFRRQHTSVWTSHATAHKAPQYGA